MKHLILVLSIFGTFSAYAGSTVCAGPTLYYSDVVQDLGAQPMPGTVIGKTVVVYDGETLVNEERIAGLGMYKPHSHTVQFEGSPVVVEDEGNRTAGYVTFYQMAVLYKTDEANPATGEEVAREGVVCRTRWAMVP